MMMTKATNVNSYCTFNATYLAITDKFTNSKAF